LNEKQNDQHIDSTNKPFVNILYNTNTEMH
jgi:hypothetical protein